MKEIGKVRVREHGSTRMFDSENVERIITWILSRNFFYGKVEAFQVKIFLHRELVALIMPLLYMQV